MCELIKNLYIINTYQQYLKTNVKNFLQSFKFFLLVDEERGLGFFYKWPPEKFYFKNSPDKFIIVKMTLSLPRGVMQAPYRRAWRLHRKLNIVNHSPYPNTVNGSPYFFQLFVPLDVNHKHIVHHFFRDNSNTVNNLPYSTCQIRHSTRPRGAYVTPAWQEQNYIFNYKFIRTIFKIKIF